MVTLLVIAGIAAAGVLAYLFTPLGQFVNEFLFMIGLVQFTINVWHNLTPEMQKEYGSPIHLYQELVFTHEAMEKAERNKAA